MKKTLMAVLILFALAATGLAQVQRVSVAEIARSERERRNTLEASRGALVNEVLRLSGVQQDLERMAAGFSASVDQQFVKFPEDVRQRLSSAGAESFNSAKLLPILERTFSNEMDYGSLVDVQRWYTTPTGAHVRAAEGDPESIDDYHAHLAQFAADLQKSPLSASRTAVFREYHNQTQTADHTVILVSAMIKAMLAKIMNLSSATPTERDVFLAGFEKGFNATGLPAIRTSVVASTLYEYRALNEDEIMEYTRFWSTPAGKTYAHAIWDGLQSALIEGGSELGQRYAEILRKK